jgi:phage shock protein E
MMRKLMVLVMALSLALTACGGTDTAQVTLVDTAEAVEMIESNEVVVLDVRTPEEVAVGKLPGARNIDLSAPDFTEQLDELDRDATYLVYCQSGNRSRQATAQMPDLGFTDVYELDGGVVSWVEQGRPLSGRPRPPQTPRHGLG